MKSNSVYSGILFLFLLGCGNPDKKNGQKSASLEVTADSLFSSDLIKRGDSLIKNIDRKEIEVYVKTPSAIIKVVNGDWPNNIDKTYNLIAKNKELIYIEIPYSQSGDWNNTYTYYFDKEGNTRAIKVVSSFFNSQCVEGAVTEETQYLYGSNFKNVGKTYYLQDTEGNIIKDTSKCVFNYRFDFPIYNMYSKTPLFDYITNSK